MLPRCVRCVTSAGFKLPRAVEEIETRVCPGYAVDLFRIFETILFKSLNLGPVLHGRCLSLSVHKVACVAHRCLRDGRGQDILTVVQSSASVLGRMCGVSCRSQCPARFSWISFQVIGCLRLLSHFPLAKHVFHVGAEVSRR